MKSTWRQQWMDDATDCRGSSLFGDVGLVTCEHIVKFGVFLLVNFITHFTKPGSEAGAEDKIAPGPRNSSAEWLSLATLKRSVPVLGHFYPGASLSPEECQGGVLETFPQLRMNGCPPNTLPTPTLSPLEEQQKTATGPSSSESVCPSCTSSVINHPDKLA